MKRLLIPMLIAVFLLFSVQAQALTITLDDTVNAPVVVNDGGPGDSNPLVGAVTWIGSLGVWLVNVSTGISQPILGGPGFAQMDLNSVDISTAAGTLEITFFDSGFAQLPGQETGGLMLVNEIGGTFGGTATGVGSIISVDTGDTWNVANAVVGPGADSDTATFMTDAFSGSFNMLEVVTIVHESAGTTSFDKEFSAAVPEPATMLLSGLGLLFTGFYLRRRFKKA